MRAPRLIAAALVLCLLPISAAGAAEEAPSGLASVMRWAGRLQATDADQEQRDAALAQLRKAAAGVQEDPRTREANFAIALFWQRQPREAAIVSHAVQAMTSATTLYPDDERTPAVLADLAQLQMDNGDRFGAHLAFTQWIDGGAPDMDPATRTLAADNASRVQDFKRALTWAENVSDLDLEPADRFLRHLALLKSGVPIGRAELALQSAHFLEQNAPETLHMDPEALLASATALAGANEVGAAIRQYELYVNVHASSERRPRAMLDFAALLAREGRMPHSRRMYDWVLASYPGTEAADFARLARLELGGRPATADEVHAYINTARIAGDTSSIRPILDRFVERFLGAGLALEVFTALAGLAIEARDTDELAPIAAKEIAGRTLDPVLQLLGARRDNLAVALVVMQARQLGLPLPRARWQAVMAGLRGIGLPRPNTGPLDDAIDSARQEMARGDWFVAVGQLEQALGTNGDPFPPAASEARLLMAEALWRIDKRIQAQEQIGLALEITFDLPTIRALRTLRGDILFSAGDVERACDDYRAANEIRRTPWIDAQLQRCGTRVADGGRP